jgi:hypothetical protein
VPLAVAIEKLRGFVADHHAEVVSIDGKEVRLKMGDAGGIFRRSSDRHVPLIIDLQFEEVAETQQQRAGKNWEAARTKIYAAATPQRNRDRRKAGASEHARTVLSSLRAYLMATEEEIPAGAGIQRRGKRSILSWRPR